MVINGIRTPLCEKAWVCLNLVWFLSQVWMGGAYLEWYCSAFLILRGTLRTDSTFYSRSSPPIRNQRVGCLSVSRRTLGEREGEREGGRALMVFTWRCLRRRTLVLDHLKSTTDAPAAVWHVQWWRSPLHFTLRFSSGSLITLFRLYGSPTTPV